eukprot:1393657-Amphidinium_carterae.1
MDCSMVPVNRQWKWHRCAVRIDATQTLRSFSPTTLMAHVRRKTQKCCTLLTIFLLRTEHISEETLNNARVSLNSVIRVQLTPLLHVSALVGSPPLSFCLVSWWDPQLLHYNQTPNPYVNNNGAALLATLLLLVLWFPRPTLRGRGIDLAGSCANRLLQPSFDGAVGACSP